MSVGTSNRTVMIGRRVIDLSAAFGVVDRRLRRRMPLNDSGEPWLGAAWSGWEVWPHPLLEQSATGRTSCLESGAFPLGAGCIWNYSNHCFHRKRCGEHPDYVYTDFQHVYMNDLYGRFDPFRYSVFAVRAYFYKCAYHDGSTYVLPAEFSVARFAAGAAGCPAERPFVSCSWDFSAGSWELIGAGAPSDETVRRAQWPQRIFDLMAGPEEGPMETHDQDGNALDHLPYALGQSVINESCGSYSNRPLYGLNHHSASQVFADQDGVSVGCLRECVLPAFARHDLVVVARVWKRRARKGQKDSARYCNPEYCAEYEAEHGPGTCPDQPWYADGVDGPRSPDNGGAGSGTGASGTQANTELFIYADICNGAPPCAEEE